MRPQLQRIARALGVHRDKLPPDNEDAASMLATILETKERHAVPLSITRVYPDFTVTELPFRDGSSISARLRWNVQCEEALPCGSKCVLSFRHVVPCECAGDTPGYPGSCPA